MTERNISIWKVEEFLIENLRPDFKQDGSPKVEADCSLKEFLERFENYIK